jgi:hypothetical protein
VESRTKALRLKRAWIECYEPTREAAMAAFAKSWRRRAAPRGTARTISVDLSRVLINAQI